MALLNIAFDPKAYTFRPELPAFDRAAIKAHVEIFHALAKGAGIDGKLVLFKVGEDPVTGRKEGGHAEHFPIGDVTGMVDAILAAERIPHLNVYVPWAVFRKDLPRGSKGAEKDILAVLALVVDQDADTGKAGPLPLPAPYVIESSAGNFQAFYPLAQALPAREAKTLAEALADAIGCDSGTRDMSHVWRVAGTRNWPNKRKVERGRPMEPQLVRVEQAWTGELIDPEALRDAVEEPAKPKPEAGSTANGHAFDFSDAVAHNLPPGLWQLIRDGVPEGKRSEKFHHAVGWLKDLGKTPDEIEAILAVHPDGIAAKYNGRLRKEIDRCYDKAENHQGEQLDSHSGEGNAEAPQQPPLSVKATPFKWIDPKTIPPRQFLYGQHFIRKFLSTTVAPGGLGKSSLVIVEALAMASGKNLLGVQPKGRSRVWYWNGEDPQEELDRRIIAAAVHYGLTPEDFEGYLFVDSGRTTPIVIAEQTKNGAIIAVPVVEAVIQTIRENGIDVGMVDPFVSSHRVSENDNAAVERVAKTWSYIADVTNSAIDLTHHTRKTGGAEITVEDGRGASALLSAARSGRVLNPMTEDEAAKAGVEKRRLFFRVDNGKANLAPPPEGSTWFQMVGVELGNSEPKKSPFDFNHSQGDNVGVATSWEWPNPLDDVTVKHLREVQRIVAAGRYRENHQSSDWVGKAIAQVLNLDPENKADKAKILRILKIWRTNGMFVIVTGKDANHIDRPFVEVGEWAAD